MSHTLYRIPLPHTVSVSHTQSLSLALVLAYTSFSSASFSFWHWWEFQGTRLCFIHSVHSISLPASLYHLFCYITTIFFAQGKENSLPSRRSSNPYGLARNMSQDSPDIGRSMRVLL